MATVFGFSLSSCAGSKTVHTGYSPTALRSQGNNGRVGGPQLGSPGGGPVIDKSGDTVLQAMIKTEVPEFRQLQYNDTVTGKTLTYNLFTPKSCDPSRQYPLVLFMADASTPGSDAKRPLPINP